MQLVMPPSPFVSLEAVVGIRVYAARAMLHGKGHDVKRAFSLTTVAGRVSAGSEFLKPLC